MSNCAALEIVDDKYRLITSDASYHGIEAYGVKSYWNNGQYYEEKIDDSDKFKPLEDLLSKRLEITSDEIDFCINPEGENKYDSRADVRINANARNSSAIEVIYEGDNPCR